MTRHMAVARVRPVFTITSVGSGLAVPANSKVTRPTTEAKPRPLVVLSFPEPKPSPARIAALVMTGAATDVAILGTAGWMLGRSELGAAILAGLALAVVLVVVLLSTGGRVHCPGCPR